VPEAAPAPPEDPAAQLIDLYPVAVRDVYGYLIARCGDERLAEDLTADAFMAAVDAIRRRAVDEVTTGWLVTVARRRLVDHWRRKAAEERKLRVVGVDDVDDPWDAELDVVVARAALAKLSPDHRAVLTLRYLDGLPTFDVAALMARSPAATDSLLQRARAALRDVYLGGTDG
jgi:RNA polymerase sigma-70 factor (ECF subfamily)